MIEIATDDAALRQLGVEDVAAYLDKIGWKRRPHPNKRFLVFEGPKDDDGKPIEMVLPSEDRFDDTLIRLSEAVNLLSAIQNTSPRDVIEAMR